MRTKQRRIGDGWQTVLWLRRSPRGARLRMQGTYLVRAMATWNGMDVYTLLRSEREREGKERGISLRWCWSCVIFVVALVVCWWWLFCLQVEALATRKGGERERGNREGEGVKQAKRIDRRKSEPARIRPFRSGMTQRLAHPSACPPAARLPARSRQWRSPAHPPARARARCARPFVASDPTRCCFGWATSSHV